jgi:hypothetical protein
VTNSQITIQDEHGPQTSIEQRCVKSCLHGPDVIRTYINNLVIATSELEARASLLYTLSLLRCSEQEGLVPIEMFSQIFMTRCLGAARRSEAKCVFKPSAICQRYLTDALQHVPPVSDYDFTYFGQLQNQMGRRMHTMVMTNLCTHMKSRCYKAIRTSIMSLFPQLNKSVCSFVTKHVLWTLSGAPDTSCRRPDPLRYKDDQVRIVGIPLLDDPTIIDLIHTHTDQFHRQDLKIDPDDGYFSDENMKSSPHIFFQYQVFLFQVLEQILQKAPFQLVPQFKMKRRSITLGVEQVAEMMQRLSKKEGLLEKIGIDFGAIPSREDVFSTSNQRRIQKQQVKRTSHARKRQRVQELEDELTDVHLPERKRMRTENYLHKAQEKLQTSLDQIEKASAVKPKTEPPKPQNPAEVSKEQWKQCHRMVASRLFFPPRDAQKHWNGVITTDGISCSWHQSKERFVPHIHTRIQSTTKTQTKKQTTPKTTTKTKTKTKTKQHRKEHATPIEIVPLTSLGPTATHTRPKDYGTHGDTVWIEPGPLTIIAVDPGHATLVDAVRYHPEGVHIEPLPIDSSRRQKRRHHLQQKLASNDRTHFSLTNAHWQVVCGRRGTQNRMQHLMSRMGLQPAIGVLSQNSSRVSTSAAYMNHLHARLATLDTMKRLVKAKAPSRWKFECYQKEQLAAHQLSKDLLFGCTGPSIVVWGNGGFGPTSRGHASAPNKRLRRLLSKYIPVVLSSEYGSSQRSACCHSKLVDRPSPKRVTVKQCTTCKTLLSRDVSAACIILDIFEFQRRNQTRELPAFIY